MAMTVRELIDRLGNFDPEAEVRFGHDYGDYGHTLVAAEVRAACEAEVVHSEYHRMDRVVEDDGEDQAEDDTRRVVLLS